MMTVNEEISVHNVIEKVAVMFHRGYRLVTLSAVDCGDHFEVYYHFDKEYELYNMRLNVDHPGEIPSISGIYFCALVIENEIQDLFGITFSDLALDCKKRFLLDKDAPEKPFCRVPGVSVSIADKTPGGVK